MKRTNKILFSLCVLSSLAFGYSDTVYNVQTQLSELGYSVGGADGKLGRGTAKAIRQYQEDNGLRVNGRVTKELLGSLGGSKVETTAQSNTNYSNRGNYQNSSDNSSFLDNIKGGNLANNLKNGKYKIGFLAAWPSYGASLKVDYSDKITLEVVAAPLGTFSSYSARVDYYLTKERTYSTYAYAGAGVAMYDYTLPGNYDWKTGKTTGGSDTETVPMFGAGVGIEWSWRTFLGNDFPDLYSTIEFGYANMSFDYYDFGGFMYGGGIYYKF